MGYLMYIKNKDDNHYSYIGCKHYGYNFVSPLGESMDDWLDSYKYLYKIKKFNGCEFFGYDEVKIELGHIQFKRFITLYREEYMYFDNKDIFEEKEIQDLINSKTRKVISWME